MPAGGSSTVVQLLTKTGSWMLMMGSIRQYGNYSSKTDSLRDIAYICSVYYMPDEGSSTVVKLLTKTGSGMLMLGSIRLYVFCSCWDDILRNA